MTRTPNRYDKETRSTVLKCVLKKTKTAYETNRPSEEEGSRSPMKKYFWSREDSRQKRASTIFSKGGCREMGDVKKKRSTIPPEPFQQTSNRPTESVDEPNVSTTGPRHTPTRQQTLPSTERFHLQAEPVRPTWPAGRLDTARNRVSID